MDARVFTEPQQGASYEQLLAIAIATERAGFEGFFRSDHYLRMGDGDGLPGPTDAWITLAGLARETERISLGTLVNSMTFRQPGVLAISVAQVGEMSGGRVELGLGAGWYEAEHSAYGLPFPDLGERFERLEEQLAIVSGLWDTPTGAAFNFEGTHYQVVDSPALPKPTPRRPRVIIGGGGKKRTPRLAATYADEFNLAFRSVDQFKPGVERVAAACDRVGRDPNELVYSTALVACCGENEAEITRRAANIGREVSELRQNGLCGTPSEILDRLEEWATVGVERVYFQVLDVTDLDHVALLGSEVIAHLPT
jgi:F420-dependent oxidoreductase-like protein